MSKALKLLESGDEFSEEEAGEELNINENYAERYQNWRKKEELQKLRDKYGDHVLSESSGCSGSSSDSSHDSSEDEGGLRAGDGVQTVFDQQFLRVYGALKRKDPSIYDPSVRFYKQDISGAFQRDQEEEEKEIFQGTHEEGSPKAENGAPIDGKETMTLTQYHAKLIKEKHGVTEEDEPRRRPEEAGLSYFQELNQIKKEFKDALESGDESEELLKGTKQFEKTTKVEVEKSCDPLAGTHSTDDKHIGFLRNYWGRDNDKLEEGEKFLRDYILEKKYLEDAEELSTKVIGQEREEKGDHGPDVAESEVRVTNFHFEEPGGSQIKRFPRISNSIRDLNTKETRATKRAEAKERKKQEKEEELQRLSQLKKEELRDRLKKLEEISGNKMFLKDINLDALIDQKDFDPQKYDEYTSLLFNNEYYDGEEDPAARKPHFEFIPGIDDDPDSKGAPNCRTKDQSESEDNEPSTSGAKIGRGKKRKEMALKKMEQRAALFEDLIGGDLPTRFKYRAVQSNDFGLTDQELFFADDKELNKWASLKKTCQYRDETEERYDSVAYNSKRDNLSLKKKIFRSLYADEKEEEEEEEGSDASDSVALQEKEEGKETTEKAVVADKKKKKKKKRSKKVKPTEALNEKESEPRGENKEAVVDTSEATPSTSRGVEKKANQDNKKQNATVKKQQKKRKRKQTMSGNNVNEQQFTSNVSVDRLKAYGLSKKQIKKRKLM